MLKKLQNPLFQNYFNVGLLGVALLPLLVLTCYNHPSVVDDYCYIDTVFKYGYFEAMHFYYSGWTGRYFSILLNHSNPLVLHWFAGFKVLSFALLLGFVASLYWLIKQLLPVFSSVARWGLVGVVFFLWVLKLASIFEAFYWMAAFVTYTLPNVLTLCLVVVMMKYYQLPNKIAVAILAAFLVFATIGCSETNLTITALLVTGWFGYQAVINRKLDKFALFLVLVAAFSCFLFFASVGNEARLSGNPESRNISVSAWRSLKKLGALSVGWLLKTPLLIFTFFWAMALVRVLKTTALAYFNIPVWVAALAYFGLLWVQIFPSYYGIGIEPAPRVVNSVYLYFLLGWFYFVGVLTHYFHQKQSIQRPIFVLQWAIVVFTALVVVRSVWQSPNLKMVYGDWLSGRAAVYNQEVYARYEFIQNNPADTLYVPPLSARPQSLFLDDLHLDPNHWWNRCTSGYFGKKIIYLKSETKPNTK